MVKNGPPAHGELLRLALPNILSNLSVPLAGLVDLAILGHLEDVTPLAGVALGGLIFDFTYWGFGFLRMATTGLVAKAFGADDRSELAALFFRAFILALLIGAVLLTAQTGISRVAFWVLSGEDVVEQAGSAYFHARIWGAPFYMAGLAILGWLLGTHHVKSALIYSVVLNGANVVLDYVLIIRFGLGAAGAGYATAMAEFIGFLVGLFLIRHHWNGFPRFKVWMLGPREKLLGMLRLQRDIMVRTFCLIVTFFAFSNLSAAFGTVLLASNTILLRLLNTASYFIDGFSFSLESLAGRYAGAGRSGAVLRSLKLTLRWNMTVVTCFIMVLALFGKWLISGLTIHQPVIDSAAYHIPYLCVVLLFSGFAYIYDGFFLGLAQGAKLRTSMIVSTLLGFVPLAILARVTGRPEMLWWAMIGFMALRSLTLWRQARRDLQWQ